ncbi:HipA N-terminal domain-containing protein [Dialister invisus]|uniref:HipA N-terminal domain-containing protein n=1 Tax=Dialister invisus TaxID=218538 RepID=UPI0028D72A39|nr:HipA N-terminal domain-containing protein [Dialister invisus]
MASNQKIIFVYDDFSTGSPILMGTLYVNIIKGGESYSFEYDKEWLKKTSLKFTLDPELMPYSGRQYPSGKNIFGLFADASPDRWGRVLMNKCERILAEKEGRKPSKLYDSDYLLGVYDETRMGGIRFKTNPDGPFLSDDKETAAPPWATLRILEEASRNFESDESGLNEK